jgi:hypothetical protein
MMRIKVIIVFFTMFIISCDTDQCAEDVNLGKLELAEESRQFIPYSGNEVLTFEDSMGNIHILTSKLGRQILDTKSILRTLCRGDVELLTFDDQEEYYESQYEEIVFYDQSGNQIFYIRLTISFEEADQTDSVAIYDYLTVNPSVEGKSFISLRIITSERQNSVSATWQDMVLNNTRFIGDTVLFGREFEEVYSSSALDDNLTFYNRFNGVLAFVFNEDDYWVLVE